MQWPDSNRRQSHARTYQSCPAPYTSGSSPPIVPLYLLKLHRIRLGSVRVQSSNSQPANPMRIRPTHTTPGRDG